MNRGSARGRTRGVVVALVLVGLMALGGVANAYWKAGGSGSGSAATGTSTAVRLDPATATAGLYPGGTTSVSLTITNNNPASVRFGSLSLDTSQGSGGFAVDAGHSGCPVSALTFSTQTNGGTGFTVPARSGGVDGTLSLSLTDALALTSSAANACQGAGFTVYLAAGP